jgi:hypothetical protein
VSTVIVNLMWPTQQGRGLPPHHELAALAVEAAQQRVVLPPAASVLNIS